MPTIVCDLDGVVYLGDDEIPGSGDALREFREDGWTIVFCTNNSTRTPEAAARKIERVTGFEGATVVTSALAAASIVSAGTRVYVLGGEGLVAALAERGCEVTSTGWQEAEVVVVGLDPELSYERLSGAVLAIGNGARFVASNHDPTYPTPAGLRPGAGSIVAAVRHATGVDPVFAGKPHAPMRDLLAGHAEGETWMVGDRDDTDLAMGRAAGWRTVHVRTGVPGIPSVEPTLSVPDLATLARQLL